MTVRPTGRLLPGEGEELVRRTLEDLKIASDRDEAGGVSYADMARALDVSDQRVADMADKRKPAVNLRAGQILALPANARRSVLAALNAAARKLDVGSAPPRSIDSRNRRVGALRGRFEELLERADADGVRDADEKRAIQVAWLALVDEVMAGASELDAERESQPPAAPVVVMRGAK